ncbi:MAG TPA: energy-coupling factor transporter ATPase [Clostridiaceae bacterium]|nr:energy-coupling factor transporter ATPase [Clostridiaceae bacterium]
MSIVVTNLTHTYMKGGPFEKTALYNINLKIDDNEFVGIIGPTGSGKSTLVQHFNGLLKPTSGKVYVNGMDTTGSSLKELRKQVGIVFQYPEHQLFEETVYKDIAFGLKKMGLKENEIEERVCNSISSVGLSKDVLHKSPFELSGGQKRRVAIAGILVMNPRILVLDEPAAGLDPRGRDEIYNLIVELHNKKGLTVILVSHSMEDIAKLARRVIVMNEGKIVMDGQVEEVFKNAEKLESIGLSVPQITYLMKKLKAIIPGLNENIFTVDEAKREIVKYLKKAR